MRGITILLLLVAVVVAGGCEADDPGRTRGPVPEPSPEPPPDAQKQILLKPHGDEMTKQAPDRFKVVMETTKGEIVLAVNRAWAPKGVDRFFNLVRNGFFDDTRFFRVVTGFVIQFGLSGDPEINAAWREATIRDDPVRHRNRKGTLSFAKGGPDTRTTQVFINLLDNSTGLDSRGFAPFAEVVEGWDVVEKLFSGYGEGAPEGNGPDQGLIQQLGNRYLKQKFPKLDVILKARVVEE